MNFQLITSGGEKVDDALLAKVESGELIKSEEPLEKADGEGVPTGIPVKDKEEKKAEREEEKAAEKEGDVVEKADTPIGGIAVAKKTLDGLDALDDYLRKSEEAIPGITLSDAEILEKANRVTEWADQFYNQSGFRLEALQCLKALAANGKKWSEFHKANKPYSETDNMSRTQRATYNDKRNKERSKINKEEDAIRVRMRGLEERLLDHEIKEARAMESVKKSGVDVLNDFLEKSKYTSRKRVGDKWVYEYVKPKKGEKKAKVAEEPEKKEMKVSTKDAKAELKSIITDVGMYWGSGHGTKQETKKYLTDALLDFGRESLGWTVAITRADMKEIVDNVWPRVVKAKEKWIEKSEENEMPEVTGTGILKDYLEKASAMPTGAPTMGGSGEEQGGKLAGVGTTSGSSDSPPLEGTTADGGVKGVPGAKKEKLSDDDEDEKKQMTQHKKPIETIRKGVTPTDQRAMTAHEQAVETARLQKGEEDIVLHPYQQERVFEGIEDNVERIVKSEGGYSEDPTLAPAAPIIQQGVLCKSCGCHHTAAVTACPRCGDGTMLNRGLPGVTRESGGVESLQKGQSVLRRARRDPDLVFQGGAISMKE